MTRANQSMNKKDGNLSGGLWRPGRQPVHTVYGGAHLFASGVAGKFSARALESIAVYAPGAQTFSRALGLSLDRDLAEERFVRVLNKLNVEAIEDYRIDFEDGFGSRSSEEEDRQAARCAEETGVAMKGGLLPPFFGIRIKPVSLARHERAFRTVDLYLGKLCEQTDGALPGNFVVCLPKVSAPEEVEALVKHIRKLEKSCSVAPGSVGIEIMIETPAALMGIDGRSPLRALIAAAEGRCRAMHFGPYDFTAALDIGAADQRLDNPVCDAARLLLKLGTAGSGISLADGPVTTLPVGPHRAPRGGKLTKRQSSENRRVVHTAWRESFRQITRAIAQGYHRGWDLHPAQLPVRYAAVYAFYLSECRAMSARMKHFLEEAGKASLHGALFDDAATGEGMLNFFRRGLQCGALTGDDVQSSGLTIEDLASTSILPVIQRRLSNKG